MADIPGIIAERIEAAHPRPALFSAAETDDWPNGALDHLLEDGILQRAQRAEAVMCPGCDWQCHKPVIVRTLGAGPSRHAFIVCDEQPDHGRQPVTLRSLDQYSATIDGLSIFLADQMVYGPPRSSPHGASSLLGTIKGRHGLREVSISLSAGQILLSVGQQAKGVARILCWTGTRLSIDMAQIRRLANRKELPQRSRSTYLPDRTMQQERSRKTRIRHEAIFREAKKRHAEGGRSWTAIADAIAATDLSMADRGVRLSAATVRRIITEMRRCERESSRSNRKRRR